MLGWGERVKIGLKIPTSCMFVPCYEKSDKDKINVWQKREERSKREKK